MSIISVEELIQLKYGCIMEHMYFVVKLIVIYYKASIIISTWFSFPIICRHKRIRSDDDDRCWSLLPSTCLPTYFVFYQCIGLQLRCCVFFLNYFIFGDCLQDTSSQSEVKHDVKKLFPDTDLQLSIKRTVNYNWFFCAAFRT
jgi:hypothetical protein